MKEEGRRKRTTLRGLDSSVMWCVDNKANQSPRSADSAWVQGPSLIRTHSKRKADVRGTETWTSGDAWEWDA